MNHSEIYIHTFRQETDANSTFIIHTLADQTREAFSITEFLELNLQTIYKMKSILSIKVLEDKKKGKNFLCNMQSKNVN